MCQQFGVRECWQTMALARGGKGDIALEPSERTPTVFFVRFSDAMADALEQDDAGELTVTLDERAGQQVRDPCIAAALCH